MELNDYQRRATETAIYPDDTDIEAHSYCALKLNGEAGEVAELVGKAIRDDGGRISEERRQALKYELGDVMWYVANLANDLGFTLDDVCNGNLKKLSSRKERGVLQGSGSNR